MYAKQKRYFWQQWWFMLTVGFMLGFMINHYFELGYIFQDMLEFIINKVITLLTSWAFIIFVLILILLKPLKELLKSISNNIKPAVAAYASNIATKQKDQQLIQSSPDVNAPLQGIQEITKKIVRKKNG